MMSRCCGNTCAIFSIKRGHARDEVAFFLSFFFWQRKMIVVLHVYRLCEALRSRLRFRVRHRFHEAKVCHVICRMMQDVENP